MTPSSGRPSATVVLVAATLAATVVGGALGLAVVRSEWSPTVPILLGGLGLIALAGIVLVHAELAQRPAAVVRAPSGDGGAQQRVGSSPADPLEDPPAGQSAEHPASERPAPRSPAEPPAAEHAAPAPAPSGEQVQLALPVPSGQWWGRGAASVPASGSAPAARHAPPPDLETYLQTSIIAQCPRCGGFQLDARPVPPGYRFGCLTCGFGWDWRPDQPWPAVRVTPHRRWTDATDVDGT